MTAGVLNTEIHRTKGAGTGNRWLVLVAMTGSLSMIMLDQTVVTVALPSMSRELPLSSAGQQWVVNAGIAQIFLAIGPLLGGVLTQAVTWRAVFWLNVPVGVAALVLVHVARPVDARQPCVRVDARAVVLLVSGVAATVLAVQQASVWSWTSPRTVVVLLIGVAVTGWFVVIQLRAAEPLVDVRLFGRPAFLGNLVVLGLVQFGLLAVVLYSSLYFQDLLHLSPIRAGLGSFPLILALAAAAQLGGRWYDRAGVRPPVLTGLALSIVGLAGWAAALPHLVYGTQVPGMVLTGFGLGLIMSPTNTDALGRVDAAQRSQASGLVQTVRQLGGTFGVAIIGAIVLGIEHRGTYAGDPQRAADAITVGFLCAAAAFTLALVAGSLLLCRDRLVTEESADPMPQATGVGRLETI